MNISRIEQIEKSMHLHGQLQPIVVRPHEGQYQVIDGLKRAYIAIDLLMETLECYILDVDEQQAKILLMNYNRSNQSMEVWEEALVLKNLMEAHNVEQRHLAKLIGYSSAWVSRRLSLISKLDEEVSSEIRMGVLNSSHARALTRLPRGNQLEIARIITSYGLSYRLSNRLIDAYLDAEDEAQQQKILAHPEYILWDQTDLPEHPYDDRLSSYGNDLMESIMNLFRPLHVMLTLLDDGRIGELTETEKIITSPFLREAVCEAERLIEATTRIQIHKPNQDER